MSGSAGSPGTPGSPAGGGARERILGRIREALDGREAEEHPGAFPGEGAPGPASGDAVAVFQAAFEEAFRAAGGEVVLLPDEEAAGRWLREEGPPGPYTVGDEVEPPLRPGGSAVPAGEAEVGVSRALAAAADTGTLLLDSAGGRAGQVLPPTHVVWVYAEDLHATLGAALRSARGRSRGAVLALHSGPSKSADIGRIVVTGVHGPGRVVAAVIGGPVDETERPGMP